MKIAIIIVSIIALVLVGISLYLLDANRKLALKVDKLQKEKAGIAAELDARIAAVSQEKEEEIARLKSTYDELVSSMEKEIEDGQVTITQLADRLSVSMIDKILFPSGEAEITPEGLKVLERVGTILKNTQDKMIRVEGHTDNVPIHPNLQDKFATNWELSTARATNVVRFLQDKIGIKGIRLQAVGMSEYHPVASNETSGGRSQNRRIEINLLPEFAGGAPLTDK
jgi:chemotaxis protein MotB